MTTTETCIQAFEIYQSTRNYAETARRLGTSYRAARRWAFKGGVLCGGGAAGARPDPDAAPRLDTDSWAAWLETQRIGCEPNSADARALHRWRVERITPTLWTADRFAVRHGLHINDYFDWCEHTGHQAWAGAVPAFETEPLTDHDWAEIARVWPNPDERIAA